MVGIGVLPSLFLPLRSSPPGSLLFCYRYVGSIVRISPHELHISDPVFFDQLYRQDGVWDNYDWSGDALPARALCFSLPSTKYTKHIVNPWTRSSPRPEWAVVNIWSINIWTSCVTVFPCSPSHARHSTSGPPSLPLSVMLHSISSPARATRVLIMMISTKSW